MERLPGLGLLVEVPVWISILQFNKSSLVSPDARFCGTVSLDLLFPDLSQLPGTRMLQYSSFNVLLKFELNSSDSVNRTLMSCVAFSLLLFPFQSVFRMSVITVESPSNDSLFSTGFWTVRPWYPTSVLGGLVSFTSKDARLGSAPFTGLFLLESSRHLEMGLPPGVLSLDPDFSGDSDGVHERLVSVFGGVGGGDTYA